MAVENEGPTTFDTVFKEDDHSTIWRVIADLRGMLAVLLLRRIPTTTSFASAR